MSRVGLHLYRGVRPLLPSGAPVRIAGIPTAYDRKWGDRVVPAHWHGDPSEDIAEYETALLIGLRAHVKPGDRVVVVGGGIGVTATVAAQLVTASGRVDCYEGGREWARLVAITARRNGVADRLTVHHAIVARAIAVYGTAATSPVVPPAALPDCDVLELDCEGAEVDILQNMTIRPRVVLVETHGVYDAPTPLVRSLLEGLGYRVEDYGLAEPHLEVCEVSDIRVLAGVRVSGAA
ncbi:MAG TPA: FkbM family methyltransferase [Rhodothermales bacterium]|nr:FkbM family methyltransferase [Rhodothermales bacterium]